MLRFAAYRLLWLVPTLLAMALITFLVMQATDYVMLGSEGSPAEQAVRLATSNAARHPRQK